ncbi:isoflavone reductase family protein-like protein [Aspergillus ellipticus CBS 707.79]|uniref:Isoflavone reductase family protein-like protein n=1 Tax=Aspergillus ellipticus CBS 707.79 TaxID=1448320 RepID=A0A319D3J4_9EURO|nr:isoflavone reductase family protein-like protein [Aspergillus ellipticus CBS 707.79]
MSLNNILIIGAGGNLGPCILSALDKDPHFSVSVLSRQSSTSVFPPHIKVHRITDDYPEDKLLEVFHGQDAVISTIATANTTQQLALIDAAVKAGVKHFVPSEFGTDTRNEKGLAIFSQRFQAKVDVVKYLKTREKDGLTWSAFVTGPFFDLAIQKGFMGYNFKEQKAVIFNDGKGRWSTTTLSSIGLAVKNALLIPEKTANRYLFINSFTVSQSQVLASLEQLTGSKWDVARVVAEELKAMGLAKISKGDLSGAILLTRYIVTTEGHGGDFALHEETANELLSLPKEDLDEALSAIVKRE